MHLLSAWFLLGRAAEGLARLSVSARTVRKLSTSVDGHIPVQDQADTECLADASG